MNKWTKRYLEMAKEVSTWSKDPSTQVGSVVVGSKGQILATGYNGFPRGVKDTLPRLLNREDKYKFVVHCEMNCIYNACHSGTSLNGSTLYVYGLPVCSECAKGVIQVGIKKVIMSHKSDIRVIWDEAFKSTKEMFKEAGVSYLRYDDEGNILD